MWEVIDYFFECTIQFQSVVKTSYRVFHSEFYKYVYIYIKHLKKILIFSFKMWGF